ncbi:hypothetical protein [Archaeoglobus sp.]
MLEESTVEDVISTVMNYDLPGDIVELVESYEKVFGRRDRFLWKWIGVVFRQGITLSCVDERYFDFVVNLKIPITMLDVILDDAADYYKDCELIDRAYEVIFYGRSFNDERLLFFERLWNYIIQAIRELPRFEEFFPIFEYDMRQMFDAMYYSHLVNTKPEVLNLKEAEIHLANNMIYFLYTDVDLMASPTFDKNELPLLRTVIWHTQQMARIGNWLSTWKRELRERDFTSGVFAYIVSNGLVFPDQLPEMDEIEIVSVIEETNPDEYFMRLWMENYRKVEEIGKNIRSVDIKALLRGFENLLKYHLATEGYM